MSAADLASVLLSDYLRYDMERRDAPNNDHLVFSKGHASPLIYSMLKAAGAIEEEEFLTYRSHGSRLEGHPIPNMPTVDVATGSLGQGLPISVGIALAGKRLDKLPYRVWVFCGDSEMAEGSMWEAAEHAAFWELDNLTAIIDVNRLGQRGETMYGWNTGAYAARLPGIRLAHHRDRWPRCGRNQHRLPGGSSHAGPPHRDYRQDDERPRRLRCPGPGGIPRSPARRRRGRHHGTRWRNRRYSCSSDPRQLRPTQRIQREPLGQFAIV